MTRVAANGRRCAVTSLKMSLASGRRCSIATCMLLASLNVAYADFSNDVIVDNGVNYAFHRAKSNERWAKGGPLHLYSSSSEHYHDDGSGTACDARKRTSKSHCLPAPRSCGESQ
jgi:hypothetical protein